MNLENSGRRVGRHEEIMARVTSRNDHIAASTLSQLGSFVEAAVLSVRMRIMEMMQVLVVLVTARYKFLSYSQETNAEDGQQHNFLSLGKVQATNDWQWHAEYGDVCDEVEASHDVPNCQRIGAMSVESRVPELCDRYTNESIKESDCDSPCDHDD